MFQFNFLCELYETLCELCVKFSNGSREDRREKIDAKRAK